MLVEFTKMHGTLNDFVVIDDRAGKLEVSAQLASLLLDRRAGIGGDQLLLIGNSTTADFEMLIYNSDGSRVEMCGNGIRCAALFARKRGIVAGDEMTIETLAGIIRPVIQKDEVRVDMGAPVFDGPLIPVDLRGEIFDHPLEVEGSTFLISCVSMGNPHCVVEVENPDKFDLAKWGPTIERHHLFPNRINVEFIKIINENNIRMRVWERGSGETLACGTGACASAVVCARKKKTAKNVAVHLDGGNLGVQWSNDGNVFLVGPASFVYEGKIEI